MKAHLLATLAAVAMAALNIGWFWSMGQTWTPGEGLGLAYGWTAFCTVGVYILVVSGVTKQGKL